MTRILKYLISFIISFGCAWIPMVGTFGYETALCTALLGLVFVPVLAPEGGRKSASLLFRTVGSAVLFWALAGCAEFLVAFIRDELCDIWQGLAFALLISLPSNLLAALVWGAGARMTGRKLIRFAYYLLFLGLDIGFAAYALYNWPPIVSFGHFFGYFAGSIYDESVDVVTTLSFFRVGTLILAAFVFVSQTPSASFARRLLLPVLGVIAAAGYQYGMSLAGYLPPMGRDALASELWAEARGDGFAIHYRPESKSHAQIYLKNQRLLKRYADDFKYLESFFGVRPGRDIDIWLYPDVSLKAKYMGAGRTSFARVWKSEIHLVDSTPDSTIPRHEMAHIFAAEFSSSPLGIGGTLLAPAIGWTEGLATAAEWPLYEHYNPHAWSAAILQNTDAFGDITPHKLLYGFWGLPSGIAYTLAGSYVMYLTERFGIDKVRLLSRSAPSDYMAIIGSGFADVFDGWKSYLAARYSDKNVASLAPKLYSSGSIWTRRCARARASSRAHFSSCMLKPSCGFDELSRYLAGPGDLERYHAAYSLQDAPSEMAMRSVLSSSIAKFADSPTQRTAYLAELGADMMRDAGFDGVAALMYTALNYTLQTESFKRRIEIKLNAASHPDLFSSHVIHSWFKAKSASELDSIADRYAYIPTIAYMSFVRAISLNDYERAARALCSLFYNAASADPASGVTSRAWAEVVRLVRFM